MSLEIKQLFEKFGYEQTEDGSWVDKHEIIRDGLDLSADEAFVDRAGHAQFEIDNESYWVSFNLNGESGSTVRLN